MKDIFIEGDSIYLRKPSIEKDILNGNWHQWFNDYEVTKYLVHGVFPNDKELQTKIVKDELENPRSMLLSIIVKETNEMIGIISLKSIDLVNRNAEIGLVVGSAKASGAGLEAMALLTQHAFDRLNLIKLYAGQHEGLWKWVNTLEVIGYKIEGYRRNSGIRDGKIYNTVLTGITKEDYYKLKDKNGGKLVNSFHEIHRARRSENQIPKISNYLSELNNLV